MREIKIRHIKSPRDKQDIYMQTIELSIGEPSDTEEANAGPLMISDRISSSCLWPRHAPHVVTLKKFLYLSINARKCDTTSQKLNHIIRPRRPLREDIERTSPEERQVIRISLT
ncbi:unnamed protein product [Nezara viridula]|uniref:Uncharacterized protein n=1 Tax=Nezara viridula TaxID=85310 RepID=A0A9P0MSA6_NEZVI|nr:unnamed protein product [Nezara viridula]